VITNNNGKMGILGILLNRQRKIKLTSPFQSLPEGGKSVHVAINVYVRCLWLCITFH
jgi:hypothetical protein